MGGPSADQPQAITDEARNARSAIRACLVAWCLILDEDLNVTLPADNVRAMAHTVAVQTGRLLNSGHADQLVHDITGLYWEALRTAWPARHMTILCACGSRVPVDPDQLMECRDCGTMGDIAWWQSQALDEQDRTPMRLRALVDYLLVRGIKASHQLLRSWADEGVLATAEYRQRWAGDVRLYDGPTVFLIASTRVTVHA